MEENTLLVSRRESYIPDVNESFTQYLSDHLYKKDLDHLREITNDSINNFLKTIAEIEDEFLSVAKIPDQKNPELHSFGFSLKEQYLEENY